MSIPKTLTERLKEINPDDIELYKEVFKEWLKEANLPNHEAQAQPERANKGNTVVQQTRKLLITLVDEP